MTQWLLDASALDPTSLAALVVICFFAGLVRGFSGFALSAVVISAAALILPPVELIPICWWLEMSASLMMMRSGWALANRGVVFGLVVGSAIGNPIGMALTTTVPAATSKLIALSIIASLAATQLARIRLAFLNTKPGLYGTGLLAGAVTGVSGVGGMVVALFVLARNAPAPEMRASLVMFLLLGSITSLASYLYFGVMDSGAVSRGLILIVPTVAGVLIGQRLFIPRFQPYYRPICLLLLMALAGIGILRIAI
ncbi:MAG: TSUP family transporter [Paracoccaceae bacterium]